MAMKVFCARGAPGPTPRKAENLEPLIKPYENEGFQRARRAGMRPVGIQKAGNPYEPLPK